MQEQKIENNSEEIILGGGCFWCIEAVFDQIKGIEDITSGYSGGKIKNPSYREVSNSKTNHAEVCKIRYNPNKIKLENILEIFFLSHDPTTLNRQGNDVGRHYRSIIFYNTLLEKEIISKYITTLNSTIYNKKIVTEIKKSEIFYKAEDYHQDYYKYNKEQPYCKIVITPKITKARKQLSKYY
tara:strand:- start:32 stop:580 length:549 start_codon:yes stop_codon:yes gene_type:complete